MTRIPLKQVVGAQPIAPNLTAISNISDPSVGLVEKTGAGTMATLTPSTVGRQLITGDAAAGRSAIGLDLVSNIPIAEVRISSLYLGTGTRPNTSGSNWIGIGRESGKSNVSGSNWTGIGYRAGYNNSSGSDWLAIGSTAAYSNISGGAFIAIGAAAGYSNSSGSDWTAIGSFAGYFNAIGSAFTAIGFYAGAYNTQGSNWMSLGSYSGFSSTTGSGWTAIGGYSAYDVTTGSGNTTIGYNSGRGITTGSGNTVIGANITGLTGSLTNTVIIGSGDGAIKILSDSSGLRVGSHGGDSRIKLISPNGTVHVFAVNDSGVLYKV